MFDGDEFLQVRWEENRGDGCVDNSPFTKRQAGRIKIRQTEKMGAG